MHTDHCLFVSQNGFGCAAMWHTHWQTKIRFWTFDDYNVAYASCHDNSQCLDADKYCWRITSRTLRSLTRKGRDGDSSFSASWRRNCIGNIHSSRNRKPTRPNKYSTTFDRVCKAFGPQRSSNVKLPSRSVSAGLWHIYDAAEEVNEERAAPNTKGVLLFTKKRPLLQKYRGIGG